MLSLVEQLFRKELQELLDRYKDRLTNTQILRNAQPVFIKAIGFKGPERLISSREHLQQIMDSGPSFLEQHALKSLRDSGGYVEEKFKCID